MAAKLAAAPYRMKGVGTMVDEPQAGPKWKIVESGELVYIDENGSSFWPESSGYKRPPEGVTAAQIAPLPYAELTKANAQKVVNATEAALKEAAERNISILDVEGTGAHGVTLEDVKKHAKNLGKQGESEEERIARVQREQSEKANKIREEQQGIARADDPDFNPDEAEGDLGTDPGIDPPTEGLGDSPEGSVENGPADQSDTLE